MRDGYRVMDSDLHVFEDGDTFGKYMDPRFSDRAPVYKGWSITDFPYWELDGRTIPPWSTSDVVARAQHFLHSKTDAVYAEAKKRHFDAESTLKAMDIEGIDVAILYRTFAHMLLSLDDLAPELAAAIARSFNDWLHAYAQIAPERMKTAAIVSLHDPELAAAEARRAVEQLGAVAVVLHPMPTNGRYLHAPECDVLYQEIERLGVPLGIHGTSGSVSRDYVANRFVNHPNFRTLNHASAFPHELMLAFAALAVGGVLQRFPKLSVALLEGNCGWLPWWLKRLDEHWEKYGGGEPIQLEALPSEFFLRQCYIGSDIDEELLPVVIDKLGDDRLVVSTDYPHQDGPFPHGVEEFLERTDIGESSKRKILWDNCARLYNLGVSAGAR